MQSIILIELIPDQRVSTSVSLDPNQVIVLEKAVNHVSGCALVLSVTVHFIMEPFSLVIAIVGPCVGALALPVSIPEITLVYVSISEPVFS